VRSRSLNYLIIRSSPLLGRGTLEHPSWVDRLRENELFKKRTNVLNHLMRNPVHVSVLSELILACIREDVKNQTLHLGGLTKISEHALAQKILTKLKLQTESLKIPDATHGNADAHDYSLNFTLTLQLTRIPALTINESLDRLV
jgi:dTDP-4-dehydrorhamnose reductase